MKKDDVIKILRELGYDPIVDVDMQSRTKTWKAWYAGFVQDFHEQENYQGTKFAQKVNVYSLGMWKQISELWADNMFNPETSVLVGDEQEWFDDLSQKLNLERRLNDVEEQTFALGNMATVAYKDTNDLIYIDAVGLEGMIPLRTVNGELVDCAFASKHDDETIYLNIHEQQLDGTYIIKNKYYAKEHDKYIELKDPSVKEEFESPVRLFQLHTPAIVNNFNLDSPFGISVLANAIDEIKAVDTSFNALVKEVVHGKIRVYLKEGALDFSIDGKEVIPFNPNQEEFYVVKGDDTNGEGEFITVSVPTLRSPHLIDTLNTNLNLLGRKVGLGDNVFDFKDGTIYTNTSQVISSNSKFYKTRAKHGVIMKENIKSLVEALYWLDTGNELSETVEVQMDDTIIHDKEEELNRTMQMFNAGIVSEVYVIEKMLGLTEEGAKEFLEKQKEYKGLNEEIDFE